jgi:hypothetical protein
MNFSYTLVKASYVPIRFGLDGGAAETALGASITAMARTTAVINLDDISCFERIVFVTFALIKPVVTVGIATGISFSIKTEWKIPRRHRHLCSDT